MEQTKFTCRIDLNIWCKDEETMNNLCLSLDTGKQVIQLDAEDKWTQIDSPIFHKMHDIDCYILDIEGTLIRPPVAFTVQSILDKLISFGDIIGIKLYYTDTENRQTGFWIVDSDGFRRKELLKEHWPAEIDCDQCRMENKGDVDADVCNNCLDILHNLLDKYGEFTYHTVGNNTTKRSLSKLPDTPENHDKTKEEPKTMTKDNTEYPNLTCSEEDMKKLYDVIESIGLLDTDMIIKAGDAPMFLNAACTLCNCAFAIFDGDSGNDLQKLEELSNSLHEFNRVAGDYKEAIADVEASL